MLRTTLKDRTVVSVSGADAMSFLGATISCDVEDLERGTARAGALLTPQGKILFDFMIMCTADDAFLLDCRSDVADDFIKRLMLYRMRAQAQIVQHNESLVSVAWGDDSSTHKAGEAGRDMRFTTPHVTRLISESDFGGVNLADWAALRITNGVAESGSDYALGDAFPFDVNLDQTGGVSFTKGCYVGQEVVSRMRHRGTARRRVLVATAGEALPRAETVITAGERPLGALGTVEGQTGLALCRIDRVAEALAAGTPVTAAGVPLSLAVPPHANFALAADAGTAA